MAVVREFAIEGIHFGPFALFDRGIVLNAIILPKRNGTFHEVVPRCDTGLTQRHGAVEVGLGILFRPTYVFFTGIETNIGFGQAPVGIRRTGLLVGLVWFAFPRSIGENLELVGLTVEEQAGASAAVM